ncbi:MAG: arsenate reductase ArsC [Alphaproteobacteria bacterium]|mgnify:CR=1 FL=1
MSGTVYNVLFLCTGNSARSIMAEALLNHWGRGRFKAHSAGSYPKPEPNPLALAQLREAALPVDGLSSKSWDVFARADAPKMDFVFTVCDAAANEPCPVWPGQPMTAHWGLADPAAAEGPEVERRAAFRKAFRELENRIKLFTSLPIKSLDSMSLKRAVDRIGQGTVPA